MVRTRALIAATVAALALAIGSTVALANVPLTQISSDPFSAKTPGQHRSEVEPDTFSFGGTIVSAFQVGRFFNGGATAIGFATSTDGGATWTNGLLPGVTTATGGPYDRASDASVAFDAKDGEWIVSYLGLKTPNPNDESSFLVDVVASRSTDGVNWGSPVGVDAPGNMFLDKNWTVCDNTASSPFYGHCYTEFDNTGFLDQILMSTSIDGGATWGAPLTTGNKAFGLGGQPVVRPDGRVIVPIDNAFETIIESFISTDGGASWSSTRTISELRTHTVAGNIRTSPLPSAEIDAAGNVYVVWQDCRFRRACSSNDIVLSTSSDGVSWTQPRRVPIDSVASGVDHFIPGLAVDPSTSGSSAHLGLTFYSYPSAACIPNCQLQAGFISSTNGGAKWSTPTQLAGPMTLSWLPNTNQGVMVGDYISTSIAPAGGTAHGVIAVASAPSRNGLLNQAMFTPTGGEAILGGAADSAADAILSTSSDHPASTVPATAH